MNFDINEVIANMSGAVQETVSENWMDAKSATTQFLTNRKERLALIAELRITGDLPQEKFESRLNDEKLILEAELHAVAVITKAIAQKAANAAIEVLTNAVSTALGGIL